MFGTIGAKKNIYVTLIIAAIGMGSFVFYFASKTEYARMFITFAPSNLPTAEINIQGKSYSVLLNLSSIVPLTLNKKVLSSIQKKPHGTIQFKDINGNKIERATFLIPEITMGDLTFKNVVVAEADAMLGELGMPLLKKNNLMLDLPHSTIIACNSKDQLKKIGYILEDMVQVPFEMIERAGGVTFPVSTDRGMVRLALCTGSTFSLIKSLLVKENDTHRDELGSKFTSSAFVIGERNWGRQELYLSEFPDMEEMNGLIGMDFLSKHVVYIDFKNTMVYIGDRYETGR